MKNIRKFTLKKRLPLTIVFVYSVIVSPFLLNDYSFKFLNTAKYWVSIIPMLILFPILLYMTIDENKN